MAYVAIPAASGGGGGGGTITTASPVSGDGSAGTPATIADGALGLPKLAAVADQRILGNVSGSSASPIALTASQVQTMLGILSSPGSTGLVYFTTGSPGTLSSITSLTGLVATSSALSANLSVGVSGGQSAIGGTGSGDSLTLSSSSNGTKGKIVFGSTAQGFIDETQSATATAGPLLSIGIVNSAANYLATFTANKNTINNLVVQNNSTGTAAGAAIFTAGTVGSLTMYSLSSGYTTSGVLVANASAIEGSGGSLIIGTISSNKDTIFVGPGRIEWARFAGTTGALTYKIASTVALGFFGATPVAQQTVGANVNNVAASGTTGQFDDFTNGTVYATDYAALHATVYQLTRSVAQHTVALRNLGFGV